MRKILLLFVTSFCLFMTQAFGEIPPTPSGLSLTATGTAITVKWTANTDDITDGYYISHWVTGASTAPTRKTFLQADPIPVSYTYAISGLTDNTKYTVQVTAYDGSDESSATSLSITTTTLDINVELAGPGTLQIDLAENATSIDTYDIYMGTASVPKDINGERDTSAYDIVLDNATGLPSDTVYSVTGLSNGTYYLLVTVHYSSGNSGVSDEIIFAVEDFGTFFSGAGEIDNGCFIGNVSSTPSSVTVLLFFIFIGLPLMLMFRISRQSLLPALLIIFIFASSSHADDEVSYKNNVGIKGGVLVPAENIQDDVYSSIVPYSFFYERMFNRLFSGDISAGYCRSKGQAVTSSSEETGVRTDLDLIPLSASLNVNLDITSLITFYMGAGGDYWFFQEDYLGEKTKNEVSGWHGKAGFKLFTADTEFFKQAGLLVEASYTAMDRFGKNDVDLGGWTYSLGVMYCF
ncbi:MAG: fibronectin type III domain-containing protein [Proteobacteria bacterium]|nr:fibronectin type III domain-containing protein [Pseudomonadota bacterium]